MPVTAGRVRVTLVPAWDPGEAAEGAARISFDVVLDPRGRPDLAAWHADPEPWPAQRATNDGEPETGDVAHDQDGWQLRFPADPDGPALRLHGLDLGLRPGEVLTLAEPDGPERPWRVVGLA
jgi:hypothetical protein